MSRSTNLIYCEVKFNKSKLYIMHLCAVVQLSPYNLSGVFLMSYIKYTDCIIYIISSSTTPAVCCAVFCSFFFSAAQKDKE